MTERQAGELTPKDYNQQLKSIYDKIAPLQSKPEISPAITYAFITLTDKTQNNAIPEQQTRQISTTDIFTKASQDTIEKQQEERLKSPTLVKLNDDIATLLNEHTSLTKPAIKAIIGQFRVDYIDGRRMEDPIEGEGIVSFSQKLVLGIRDPQGEGIFSKNQDKVRDIERILWGAYEDFVSIGGYVLEEDDVKEWELAFKEKYGDWPYPNLHPQPKNNIIPFPKNNLLN